MEEIKVYQNITKIGLEKQTDWQLTRVTRLPKSISNQVRFFGGEIECLEDTRYRAVYYAIAGDKRRKEKMDWDFLCLNLHGRPSLMYQP